ncbi:uncharacterized protein LOC134277310 [Saccostrea cucullata]|uniref:uncharacterized protein LOC134277310 n=1 Tax=Saccostrea cuccullata TaxID=36930 RepID=UPI002ED65FBC
MTVYKAAKVYGVPKTTLLDRVSGTISADAVKSGPAPTLDIDQEARLVEHIKLMANYGYGYTRSEVVDLATSLAIHLGLREKDKPFTLNWFYSFLSRWPELKTIKARGLAMTRAKSASQENIDKYFQELEKIISKYNLQDKPYCIYNVDEKGINFQHKPPNVVSSKQSKPPGIVSENSPTLTIIGAGNALGTQIPPYLIFLGARMNPDPLQNCSEGTAGTVSASGWSNTNIFQKYLSEHFMKYVQGLTNNQPVLLMYDGHKSHY